MFLSVILLISFHAFSAAEGGAKTQQMALQLKPAEVSLKKGGGAEIRPSLVNAPKGVRVVRYEWASSDPLVTVFENGKARGIGGGEAVLTCTATLTDGTVLEAECPVHVTVPVREIRCENRTVTIMAGDVFTPEIQVLPEDATNPALRFYSSDNQILSVGADGRITALAEGKAVLTAEAEDNPSKSVRMTVTVTRRIGKTEGEITFQGIPWGSDCETCIELLKQKEIIAEETRNRCSFTSMAWHWPENDLLFSRASAWRMLPVSFSDMQTGAARTSLNLLKTIGGYLPQISTLVFFNGVEEDGRYNPETTRLTGVYFQFDSRHERGTRIFNELLGRLENQYGEFRRYLQKDIPRYYPEFYSQIQESMAEAENYEIQETGLDVYLGECAICTIRGSGQTGIMLSIDTSETVTLFYGRTDAPEMILELQDALREEIPEMDDAGV